MAEPTTGLDTKARRGVWKSLQELKKHDLAIFLYSHFMDEMGILCDQIVGGLVFEGTVKEAVALSPYEVMPFALQKIVDTLPLTQGMKLLKTASLSLLLESV